MLLQLAQLVVDKERSQTSPTLWPLTTPIGVKRMMAFSSMFQKPTILRKKNTKIHQNHQPPLEKSLGSFRIPSRSHPQPHSPQGHILRFESPSFSLSWAHPSAVAAQRNASRLAVNPGPSGGLPQPPATVHHPFQLGLRLCLGVRKICPILTQSSPTFQLANV